MDYRIEILAEVLHGKVGWHHIKSNTHGWPERERELLGKALEAVDKAAAVIKVAKDKEMSDIGMISQSNMRYDDKEKAIAAITSYWCNCGKQHSNLVGDANGIAKIHCECGTVNFVPIANRYYEYGY